MVQVIEAASVVAKFDAAITDELCNAPEYDTIAVFWSWLLPENDTTTSCVPDWPYIYQKEAYMAVCVPLAPVTFVIAWPLNVTPVKMSPVPE